MRATRRPPGPAGRWRRALGKALAVAVGFLLLAAGVAAQRSLGGSVDLWGSVGLEVDHRRLDDVSSQTAATLAAHLEGHLARGRSEEHTSELQSRENLVCRLLLEKRKTDCGVATQA